MQFNMEFKDMELKDIMKQRRAKLEITQQDLAELAQVGLATVKDIERGKGNPSISTVKKILEVLGMKIDYRLRKYSSTSSTSALHLDRSGFILPYRYLRLHGDLQGVPGRGRFQKVQGLFRFSPYSPLSDNGNIPAADINNRSDLAPIPPFLNC